MAAFALALSVLVPIRAVAQMVRGTVVDASSGEAVFVADVALLNGDSVVHATSTDASGRFGIRVPASGTYRIRVARIGYVSLVSQALRLEAGESAVLEVQLQPDPSLLEPVEVTVERRSTRLERAGFYNRLRKGFGYFLSPDDLAQLRPLFHEDLFYGMAGIRLRRDTASMTLVRWPYYKPCPLTVAVDGLVVEDWTQLVHVNDILALEVYPRPAGLPSWLSGTVSPCGAVVVWTK